MASEFIDLVWKKRMDGRFIFMMKFHVEITLFRDSMNQILDASIYDLLKELECKIEQIFLTTCW